ncbi:MAG: HAD-IB family hydrolase [Methylococcales bacterium]|nr:HAD-IB family hydrolase [Methylococcales bacterium]MDD5753673.1 HAD-IB family hydrolase [Methylococcales bacterium]
MALAIFDLDNTLIADDSDYLWGQFLVDQGIVDRTIYEQINAKFYEDYRQGTLDMVAFLRFALKPLADHPIEQLHAWRKQFLAEVIPPIFLKAAAELVDKHRALGHTLLVITATNRFITAPIVEMYGIENLIATTPELIDGSYTGEIIGIPCFQAGKVTLLNEWLAKTGESLKDSYFYSDSHNDLPLLKLVDNPVAVNPDDTLRHFAETQGWAIMNLRS